MRLPLPHRLSGTNGARPRRWFNSGLRVADAWRSAHLTEKYFIREAAVDFLT